MMKQILILAAAIVIFTPCLAVFNESDSFIPNIIGFIYIGFLVMCFRTKYGRRYLTRLYRTILKLNERIGL